MSAANFANRTLFHGDNLAFLRAMNSESADLIATDPPFNKGRDFHATPDSLAAGASFQDRWLWNEEIAEWHGGLMESNEAAWDVINSTRTAAGEDMAAFLCFMAVRLLEMHRVLKASGSIYLQCDPTASHYLKALMDAVFGRRNFRNEILWCYPPGGKGPKFGFHRKHDVILFYGRSHNKGVFNRPYTPLTASAIGKFTKTDIDGRRYKEFPGGRTYLDEIPGRPIPDYWVDVNSLGQTMSKESTGYATQKPLALYERIIAASSKEGDVVLDPFCGCATTLIAAERLGRQWVGIDLWNKGHAMVVYRLAKESEKNMDFGLTSGQIEQLREFLEDKHAQGVPLNIQEGLFNKDSPIHCTDVPPQRKDGGATAAKPLRTPIKRQRERADMSEKEMRERLLEMAGGPICQGCMAEMPDARYLQLDHIRPKADGGGDQFDNRTLLCAPCNLMKGDRLTLRFLQRENRKHGHWKGA